MRRGWRGSNPRLLAEIIFFFVLSPCLLTRGMGNFVLDLLLDQVMILAAGQSHLAALDRLNTIELTDASTLFHDFSVDLYETTDDDLDALSEADTEAGDELSADWW